MRGTQAREHSASLDYLKRPILKPKQPARASRKRRQAAPHTAARDATSA